MLKKNYRVFYLGSNKLGNFRVFYLRCKNLGKLSDIPKMKNYAKKNGVLKLNIGKYRGYIHVKKTLPSFFPRK